MAADYYKDAKLAMCDGMAMTDCTTTPPGTPLLRPSHGFALCYSGRGELHVRLEPDDATVCDVPDGGTIGELLGQGSWYKTCGVDPATDPETGNADVGPLLDGASFWFNSFSNGTCSGEQLFSKRVVHLPSVGPPFSKVLP